MFSLLNSSLNMTLPAFAAEHRAVTPGCVAVAAGRPALSIDMFCAYGAHQQTRRTPLLRSTERRGWITPSITSSWICHCSLMLVHTIYISAAVLLSEGLKVKWKYPLIVWRYRLQWFVPPLQQSRDEPHWLQGWRSRGGYSHSLFAVFLQFINQN